MSAGDSLGALTVDRDFGKLAPQFRDAVNAAIEECNSPDNHLDAFVYEAHRSEALQAYYYTKGRTLIPPYDPVTNAPSALHSWHAYGLAVDVVHTKHYWDPPGGEAWFRQVAEIFKKHNCRWGGDWTKPDTPHFQWHLCRPSPSDTARYLLATGGVQSVWSAVSAA